MHLAAGGFAFLFFFFFFLVYPCRLIAAAPVRRKFAWAIVKACILGGSAPHEVALMTADDGTWRISERIGRRIDRQQQKSWSVGKVWNGAVYGSAIKQDSRARPAGRPNKDRERAEGGKKGS